MNISKLRISGLCGVLCMVLITACQSVGTDASSAGYESNGGSADKNAATKVAYKGGVGDDAALSILQGWVLEPLANESITLVAGEAATTILETHLRRRDVPLGILADRKSR